MKKMKFQFNIRILSKSKILQKGLELMFMFMQTVSYVNRSVRMYGCIPDMYYV